jgi:sugar phosphate isomerase/epimerase
LNLSISNIALPAMAHAEYFPALKKLGFSKVEVAPSRRWINTWHELTSSEIRDYHHEIKIAGLEVCGLHSLFFDHPELSIFGSLEIKKQTSKFLLHLSKVCRDMGGKTLIFGSPSARNRDQLSKGNAFKQACDFLSELCLKIEPHNTVLCVEPLSRQDSNFLNTVQESLCLVKTVKSPALKLQIDLRAMVASNEITQSMVSDISPFLCHVHVNASDLGILKADDVRHCENLVKLLHENSYCGSLSLEQKMVTPEDVLTPIKISASLIKNIVSKYEQ